MFEESYSTFQKQQTALDALAEDRSRYSYMIHSLPTTMSKRDFRKFLDKATHHAKYLFYTYLDQNYYESFGPRWRTFVDAMPV